jgi:hypothetical protein
MTILIKLFNWLRYFSGLIDVKKRTKANVLVIVRVVKVNRQEIGLPMNDGSS